MARAEHSGGPVERLDLLGAIIDDERARLIHIKTARHILKRFYSKFGNARASVSFLQEATGLTRGSVAQATSDLVEWGYFSRIMGSGKRPTEYLPNFSVLQSLDATSVLPSPDATETSVRQSQDEWVRQPQDAKAASVLPPQEQTHLRSAVTTAATINDTAPASAGGLAAPPARAVCFEVVEATEGEDDGDAMLHLSFHDPQGQLHQDSICIESHIQRRQQTGQQRLQELLRAAGLDDIQLADDLVGARCDVLIDDDDFQYVPADEIGRRTMGIAA